MRRVLQMTFKNTDDRLVRLNVNGARQDLSAEDVKTAMENIITENIFMMSGGELAEIEEAKIIITEEEVLDLV